MRRYALTLLVVISLIGMAPLTPFAQEKDLVWMKKNEIAALIPGTFSGYYQEQTFMLFFRENTSVELLIHIGNEWYHGKGSWDLNKNDTLDITWDHDHHPPEGSPEGEYHLEEIPSLDSNTLLHFNMWREDGQAPVGNFVKAP